MQPVDLIVHGASEVVSPQGSSARRGTALAAVERIPAGAVAASGGRIVAVGPEADVRAQVDLVDGGRELDAGGRAVIPAFVDPHTHAVFGRARPEEYAARIAGRSYVEIAAAGGGIHASVRDLHARSADELYALSRERLLLMLKHGTTTVEIKTGYGLVFDQEMKMLEVIGRLRDTLPMDVVPTFLGAHEIPLERRNDRAAYVREIIETMIPAAAGRAEYNDVFCEPSVFDVAESEAILRAGLEHGLKPRIHADEIEACGGTSMACRLGARSADHLVRVSEDGVAALAAAETVAVLLPGTTFGLAHREYAPARKLIEAGVAVALATDFNPGSSHCPSMQAVWSLACSLLRMTPDEALTACTLNAAVAVDRGASVGSLEVGKRCDLLVLDVADCREVPFRLGVNNVRAVVRGGHVVWSRPGADP